MKNEITTPDHFPEEKEEDLKREENLKAAAKRREEYSLVRDEQANVNNEAIARRLSKEQEEQEEQEDQEEHEEQE